VRRGLRAAPIDLQSGRGFLGSALISVLIVIVVIAGLTFIGTAVSGHVSSIGTPV
jgi:hypothetical protein